MVDKQSLNDIFQRYLKNECSVYEIKFLLKHFISGTNDAILRELIADKLNGRAFDEHLTFTQPSLFLDENFKRSMQHADAAALSEPKTATAPTDFFLNQPVFVKIIAIITLITLLCESVYMFM